MNAGRVLKKKKQSKDVSAEAASSLSGSGGRGKFAVKPLHLRLGILASRMVGRSPASDAKPFLQLGIPSDLQMFHGKAITGNSSDVSPACTSDTNQSSPKGPPKLIEPGSSRKCPPPNRRKLDHFPKICANLIQTPGPQDDPSRHRSNHGIVPADLSGARSREIPKTRHGT